MEGLKLTWWQRHWLVEQLQQTRDAHVYCRTLAVLEVSRGQSISQVAKALAVSRQSVYNWVAEYAQRRDPHVLQDEPRSGRPSHWTEDHHTLLRFLMERSPIPIGDNRIIGTVTNGGSLSHMTQHQTAFLAYKRGFVRGYRP